MTSREQKLEIWRDLGKEFGYPVKDSSEYYRKTEIYNRILDDMSQPPPPPSPKMPVDVRRDEPELDSRQRGQCCCDCHRNDRAPLVQTRRRVIKCNSSESDDEFGTVRLAQRARRIILTSDDESDSDSDSDDEPIRRKKPVGRPSKKSVVKVKKADNKKKSTASSSKKKSTQAKVSRA